MRRKKKILSAAAAVILLAAAACGAYALRQYWQEAHAGSRYEKIREETGSGMPEEGPEETEGAEDPADHEPPEIPIDFAALQERNPEAYAWITIPGTAVDYPILQSGTDNGYYLTHSIDGTLSPEGSIYTEDYNSRDFEDPNTVIYGHDMENGSMFQNLLNYQDRSYFDSHREVIIYTPDAVRHYRVFAAYLFDERHLMQSFEFDNPWIYEAYLNMILSIRDMNSCIDTETEVGRDDKIITLSTCYGLQEDVRYLVQAVLVSIEK